VAAADLHQTERGRRDEVVCGITAGRAEVLSYGVEIFED
jgi:hypothetical protein